MRCRSATAVVAVATVFSMSGCGGDDESDVDATAASVSSPDATVAGDPTDADGEQRFPDVVGVEATEAGGTWTFAVTISSPYDTPERYADAWRVVGPDGAVYGERILLHDHAAEQPFTRSQGGIEIPAEVDEVLVEARDLEYGWGGGTMTHVLPGR